MDPTVAQWRFKVGDQVVSADDHKLGKVCQVLPDTTHPTHLVVEQGRLFRHDYRIPVDAVCNYEAGTVYLSLTKEEASNAGWEAATTAS
jgi:hypothetical protein